MNFTAWLGLRADSSIEHIRISKQVMQGNSSFPYHSRKSSLIKFCKRYKQSDTVKDALLESWKDFEQISYCTIITKPKKYQRL